MPAHLQNALSHDRFGITQGANATRPAALHKCIPYGTRVLTLVGQKVLKLHEGRIDYRNGPQVAIISDVIALGYYNSPLLPRELRDTLANRTMSRDAPSHQFCCEERADDNLLILTTPVAHGPRNDSTATTPLFHLDEWTWNIVLAYWGSQPMRKWTPRVLFLVSMPPITPRTSAALRGACCGDFH